MVRGDITGVRGAVYDRLSPGERERLLGCGLALAIVAAPFLALLYNLDAALAITALAATAVLAVQATRSGTGSPALRPRLLTAAINALLALACLVILLVRL